MKEDQGHITQPSVPAPGAEAGHGCSVQPTPTPASAFTSDAPDSRETVNSAVCEAPAPCIASARKFLSVLDATEQPVLFLKSERPGECPLPTDVRCDLDTDWKVLCEAIDQGIGIFVTINKLDGNVRRTEHVCRIRAVFVDLDGAPIEPVRDWSLTPHAIVETSPGKWHAYWMVDDQFPLAEFKPVQKALAARFNGDQSVCDLPRVMRLPGTLHQKGAPFLVRLDTVNEALPRYTYQQLSEALGDGVAPVSASKSAVPTSAATPSPSLPYAPPGTIPEGSRNTTLMQIAARLRANGMDPASIEAKLQSINASQCEPPLPTAEVTTIVRNSLRTPLTRLTEVDSLTDMGNARRLVETYGRDLRFVHGPDQWLIWEHGRWEEDREDRIVGFAQERAKMLLLDAAVVLDDGRRRAIHSHVRASLSRKGIEAAIALARAEPAVRCRPEHINRDDMLFGVQNGVVDLRSGAHRPASRQDLITLRSETTFEAGAVCPVFREFLNTVTKGDAEMMAFLQRLAGYVLTGSTREQCFFFLYGTGANGKSTFLNILKRLSGDYSAQIQIESLMSRRHGGSASPDLARLVGKRLVIANETREGGHLDESLMKQITGGDMLSTRRLYQDYFEFWPKFKLIIAGNHQPVVKGDDDGIWRRVILVPFEHVIPQGSRDPLLAEKLAAELPGILNWALEGARDWQARRLAPPRCVMDASKQYREEMDLMADWMRECCELDRSSSESTTSVYASYRDWCSRSSLQPISKPVFRRKLSQREIRPVHTRTGDVYQGIRLRPFVVH